ncbi:MAG TPA: undecaprenyldiphospho-muramoylpentapeptide beta-N-acetylglucosaminyltransferase [Bryobacteraceae bacterium]|jgi:UDP-N-acetylglucosamine--N-acetylmuramyl-(pentapeptide) pyrophosphoryl-undecaprenol N-acetylglucosamine transferase|nr:undecaprenyldiphospho-muramoylpentapeptide beta-N-acetylglucosaminyltransferase [Bryobacteraceae bacterium]
MTARSGVTANRARAFLFAGGGTGGHVIPALAVARELRHRGHSAFFVGTERGLESQLVPDEGFPLELIQIGGLKRVGLRQTAATLMQLPVSTLYARRLLKDRSVAAVFSMGGYVAGPPVLAALVRRVPVVVMEPNALPGFTNRRIARYVRRALISFPETARYFPYGRTELTGLPVRDEFFSIPPKAPGATFTVLITGGSQGSRTLNQAARQSWPLFRAAALPVRIVHQSGPADCDELRAAFSESGIEGEVLPFIADMPAAFAEADLVVCRSGAGAVAELAAAGKPAILAPFPFAADQHQLRNAQALVRAGAARLVEDREMTGAKLFETVARLAADDVGLARMGAAARSLAHPGAARRAADVLEEVARA